MGEPDRARESASTKKKRRTESSANAYLRLYGGDYLRDTMHLAAAEDGIYLRLLMHYWHTQRPLPADQRKLEGIARVRDEAERGALSSVVAEFFYKRGKRLHNKRMDSEIKNSRAYSRSQSASGRVGGKKSAETRKTRQAIAKQSASEREAKGKPAIAIATKGETKPVSPLPPSGQRAEPAALELDGKPDEKPTAASEAAYRKAIAARYGADPGPLNQKQRGQIAKMLQRIPRDEAPAIVEHYVAMDGPRGNLYASASHPIDLLLRDCEAIRLAWQTKDRKPPPIVNGANGSWYKVPRGQENAAFRARGLALGVATPPSGSNAAQWSTFYARVWIASEGSAPWHDDKDGTMNRILREERAARDAA